MNRNRATSESAEEWFTKRRRLQEADSASGLLRQEIVLPQDFPVVKEPASERPKVQNPPGMSFYRPPFRRIKEEQADVSKTVEENVMSRLGRSWHYFLFFIRVQGNHRSWFTAPIV